MRCSGAAWSTTDSWNAITACTGGQNRVTETGSAESDRAYITHELRLAGCVFAEAEAELIIATAHTRQALYAMVQQRVSGLPLEHILGSAEFCGLQVGVTHGVFVPRRRTEWLVHEAAQCAHRDSVVVDLCCGCGAIGAALVATLGSVRELHAVDLDATAVACARHNLEAVPFATVHLGDLFAALPERLRGHVDVVVANAPYVPTAEIDLLPPEARLHEPRAALDGGPDGLDVHRRVIADSVGWLAPGGHVLVETSRTQADRAVELFVRAGLAPDVSLRDESSATVVSGTLGDPKN